MKKKLDEDSKDKQSEDFNLDEDTVEELSSPIQADSADRLADDYLNDPSQGEDFAELDRRKTAYSVLKKDDKIFNNSFNMGTAIDENAPEARSRNEIRIDPGSANYNMYDKDRHSDFIDDSITQFDINSFVSKSEIIQEILKPPAEGKKKFNKIEVNDLFNEISEGVGVGSAASVFVNSIHILDAISSLTSLEFKKLFDMMSYDNKKVLLVELDKKYHFLDKSAKDFKIYE